MKIETIQIAALIPYARNSRTHSDEQVAQVAASIKEFGFTNPVLIDNEGGIIAGHGRVMAARKLGLADVPCIRLAHLTEAQKRAYIIADNKLALNSGWDEKMLALEFKDLQDMGFDLELTGFDLGDIDELLAELDATPEGNTDADQTPEVQAEVVSKLGDIWTLGKHRVMCGDSTSIDAVEALLKGIKPNAIFTDPPYGIGLDKEGQRLGKSQAYGAVLNDHDNQAAKDAFALCSAMSIPEIYFWGANHYSSCLPDSSCWIVWDKQGGKSVTYADCELCYTNIKKPVRMFTHIWDGFRRDSEKGNERVHPNQKPVKLFVDIWEKFNTGKVILDLFGGSGSTLIAAELTNRVCFMSELSPRFVDVIVRRWQQYTGKVAVNAETGKEFGE